MGALGLLEVMKIQSRCAAIVFSFVIYTDQPAMAQLPSLDEPPWLGYFAAHQSTRCTLGITSQGDIIFNPSEDAPRPTGGRSFRLRPIIEEITPAGRVVVRELDPETLQSAQPASAEIDKVVFSGKVQGGATLEVTVEQNRGILLIGGRVVDPGPAGNVKRFAISGRTPRFYATYGEGNKSKSEEQKALEAKREKALEIKLKNENLELKLLDGKRVKQSILEPVDLASGTLSGTGVAEIEIDFQFYRGRKVLLTAAPNSSFSLSNRKGQRIFKNGFSLVWRPDPEKDTDGKARMAISTR